MNDKYTKDKEPKGTERSNQWPKVRKAYLSKNPGCAVCGGKKKVEVHHKKPFHTHPELELDPNNFISLCEGNKEINCHLIVGHGGSFKDINPDVVTMAKQIHTLLTEKQITDAEA